MCKRRNFGAHRSFVQSCGCGLAAPGVPWLSEFFPSGSRRKQCKKFRAHVSQPTASSSDSTMFFRMDGRTSDCTPARLASRNRCTRLDCATILASDSGNRMRRPTTPLRREDHRCRFSSRCKLNCTKCFAGIDGCRNSRNLYFYRTPVQYR